MNMMLRQGGKNRATYSSYAAKLVRGAFATVFFLSVAFGMHTSNLSASDERMSVGVVNTGACMLQSKQGQQEHAALTSLQQRLISMAQDSEKQIEEMNNQFNDPDFMDGLSSEAEKEMKERYQGLLEEQHRYQTQFQQILNQQATKFQQTMQTSVLSACSTIASRQKLALIVQKEHCCFSADTLDVTDLVLAEMNKVFEEEQAKVAADMKVTPPHQGQEKKS